jgi:hypothetical protein
VGPIDVLIAGKFAPPEAKTRSWMRADGGQREVIWSSDEMGDGRHHFCKHLDEIELAARAEEESDKHPFATPAEMLRFLAAITCARAKSDIKHNLSVRTTHGKIFTMTKESRESIDEAIDELYSVIVEATVRVSSAVPCSPES